MQVRLAGAGEISVLQDVESDASELFESMAEFAFVLDYPARDVDEYEAIVRGGGALVADTASGIAGLILMGVVDGQGHILELSVRTKYQRQGVGRRLIEAGCQWARDRGFVEVTLTTFRDAPWNAPAYAGMGFETILPDHQHPELARILENERSIGLFRAKRVAMRRLVSRG